MWDCIKECFSTIFPAIGVYTLCVLVGAFIAAIIAAGATGGVGTVIIIGAVKAALAYAGFAIVTSSLGALVGCLGGCRIVV